jgi:pyruvate/2-oxoglutarate dehydrogenase complex dihydrolipoamide acyltransferase (E2) component
MKIGEKTGDYSGNLAYPSWMKLTSTRSRVMSATAVCAMALSIFSFSAHAGAATAKPSPKPTAAKTAPAPKPTVASGKAGGPAGNPAFAAAMTKYNACLKAQGVTIPAFGAGGGFGRNRGGANGAPAGAPTGAPNAAKTPAPRPTFSAKQQAAMSKCASLRPSFGGGRGFGGPGGPGGAPGTAGAPGAGGPGVANNPANVTAYIACLNTNGVNVSALADLQGLDRQSPKIAAALAACRSKRVAGN